VYIDTVKVVPISLAYNHASKVSATIASTSTGTVPVWIGPDGYGSRLTLSTEPPTHFHHPLHVCLHCLCCARGIIVLPLRASTVPKVEGGRPASLSLTVVTAIVVVCADSMLRLTCKLAHFLQCPAQLLFDPAFCDSQRIPRPRPLTTILPSPHSRSEFTTHTCHTAHPCGFGREAEVAWSPSRRYTVKLLLRPGYHGVGTVPYRLSQTFYARGMPTHSPCSYCWMLAVGCINKVNIARRRVPALYRIVRVL
jgi:hypothetical protein